MTIQELLNKRARVWENAKEFVSTHEGKNGELSAEDSATYERMEAEIEELTNSITRAQKMAEREAEFSKAIDTPVTSKPENTGAEKKTGRASDEYKEAYLRAIRTEFKQISDVMEEGADANGGYLVPDEYDSRLIDVLTEENIMRSHGTTITTSGEHKINIAATKPAASWIEEGDPLTFGNATFSQITLDAYKLHVAIKVTEELLYDSMFNIENYVITQFGKALANAEEDAFLNGNGTHKPTGLFVSATSAGSTANITADKLIDFVYLLKRPYRRNASFILKDSNIAAIRKLKDATGAYIWQPAYQAGEADRILGYQVKTSAYAPADKIAFGDISYYNIGDRGARSFAVLRELFAGNGMIGYVAKERVDGKLVLPEAVQALTITSLSESE